MSLGLPIPLSLWPSDNTLGLTNLTINHGLKCQDFVPVKAQLYQVFVTYNQQSSGELRVGTSVQCVMVKRTWNPNCTALVKCFYYRNVQHRQTKLKGEAEAESEY